MESHVIKLENVFVGYPDPCERVVSALQFCTEFDYSTCSSSDDILEVIFNCQFFLHMFKKENVLLNALKFICYK